MADVIWLKRARDDLDQIIAYIEVFDPPAADRIAERLHALAESLSEIPQRGRLAPRRMREMATVRPYILRYRVIGDRVVILSIRHSARRPLDRP